MQCAILKDMLKKFLHKLGTWNAFKSFAIKFIHLHFFLTLLSLPIIIFWGLPVSLLSPIGNLIFNVVLTIFLSLSSFVFFAELCGLPNKWCICLLEWTTSGWMWCLKWATPSWLIGFCKPPLIVLCLLPAGVLFLAHFRIFHAPIRNVCSLIVVFCTMMIVCAFYKQNTALMHAIEGKFRDAYVLQTLSGPILVDAGSFASTSAQSWAQYTVASELIKKTGSNKIKTVVICRPSSQALQTTALFITTSDIDTIVMPELIQWLPLSYWKSYKEFLRQAQEHGCKVHFVKPESAYLIDADLDLQMITKSAQPKIFRTKSAFGYAKPVQKFDSSSISDADCKQAAQAQKEYIDCCVTCRIDGAQVMLYDACKKKIGAKNSPLITQ